MPDFTYKQIAKMIDHSLLQQQLTDTELEQGCKLARAYDVASVCIKPYAVAKARELLAGDFGSKNLVSGQILPLGQPRTVTVTIKAGDYLWYGYMEDSSGGISGMIINPVTSTPAPPPLSSTGLFKIDFGQSENERVPVDVDMNPTGPAPDTLTNWNVIPTWTFADPNALVVTNSASILGTVNTAGTEVTWNVTDSPRVATLMSR